MSIGREPKARRPGICGAVETILVHDEIADEFLPPLINALRAQACEIRGCTETQKFNEHIIKATEEDWSTEYLLPIVSIRIVNSLNEALEHIELYSSGHTESILTENVSDEFILHVLNSTQACFMEVTGEK